MTKAVVIYNDGIEVRDYLTALNQKGLSIEENDFIYIKAAIEKILEIKPEQVLIPMKGITSEDIPFIEDLLSVTILDRTDIIAITDIKEESLRGFKLKKLFHNELSKVLEKDVSIKNRELPLTRLPVSKDGIVYFIDYSLILFMTTHEKETHIYTEEKIYTSQDSLKVMENRLYNSGFMKCHRSYIVNLNKIDKLTYWNNGVYLLSFKSINETIPVSRGYYKLLKQALKL